MIDQSALKWTVVLGVGIFSLLALLRGIVQTIAGLPPGPIAEDAVAPGWLVASRGFIGFMLALLPLVYGYIYAYLAHRSEETHTAQHIMTGGAAAGAITSVHTAIVTLIYLVLVLNNIVIYIQEYLPGFEFVVNVRTFIQLIVIIGVIPAIMGGIGSFVGHLFTRPRVENASVTA